jgi:2-polyprenyl-3-methyl-5-hydroxy-6-metoxy-1,4-benzoquinol methylase
MFKEPQYNLLNLVVENDGITEFGLMVNQSWNQDPKRFLFTLSRYKFVSKMFEGFHSVLEIGCADAFGTRLVQQTVNSLSASDFDPIFIQDVERRMSPKWKMEVFEHDILKGATKGKYQGVFCLDVLEHIEPNDEEQFMRNIVKSLDAKGAFIAGMPSLESQAYASPQSLEGHVNCKNGDELRRVMKMYFENVFIFSMNDEVLHTGFLPMSQYIFALCTSPK